MRRAGSPVHFSSTSEDGEVDLRRLQDAHERLVGLAGPRVGGRRRSRPRTGTRPRARRARPSPGRRAPRPTPCGGPGRRPTGCPGTSMPLKAVVASCGNSDSIITRLWRRPMSVAGHRVDQHRARLDAGARRSCTPRARPRGPARRPAGRCRPRAPRRASTVDLDLRDERRLRLERRLLLGLPRDGPALRRRGSAGCPSPFRSRRFTLTSCSTFIGLSGLPVACAGHDVVAAAALGAGERVEEALPRQLLDAVDAELLGLLEVDLRRKPVALPAEEPDVRPGEDEVHVLGRRQVGGEAEEDEHVRPPAERAQALRGGSRAGPRAPRPRGS